jgi:uncharacterized protein YndB with AHSA1/START domain
MADQGKLDVVVRRRFAAPPERVFEAWLDPAQAGQFLFATPVGTMVRAETDPHVGGRYVFVDRRDGVDIEHTGEYLELDPPRRLAFTLAVTRYAEAPTRVVCDLSPLPAGGCELTLTHEIDVKFADFADRTAQGWAGILDGLAQTLGESA